MKEILKYLWKTATIKNKKMGFKKKILFNAGRKFCKKQSQKYCRMLSAILSTFFKLPFVIKIIILSIFEWPFYTGFTVIFLDWYDGSVCMYTLWGHKL